MQHTETEKTMLEKVNEVGLDIEKSPEADLIFVVLSPYLDNLMALLKRLSPTEMEISSFYNYLKKRKKDTS